MAQAQHGQLAKQLPPGTKHHLQFLQVLQPAAPTEGRLAKDKEQPAALFPRLRLALDPVSRRRRTEARRALGEGRAEAGFGPLEHQSRRPTPTASQCTDDPDDLVDRVVLAAACGLEVVSPEKVTAESAVSAPL
eukprot:g19280.t1